MIEKLQKISAEMFKQMLITYKLKDVITHKRASHINANQYCALFPNKGVNFNIQKKTWPKGSYITVKQVKYKSNRLGHFYGIQMFNNEPIDQFPKRLQGMNKRGVWNVQLGDFKQFTADNNVTYTRADFEAYVKIRRFNNHSQNNQAQIQQTLQGQDQNAEAQQVAVEDQDQNQEQQQQDEGQDQSQEQQNKQ